jgi:hypothetical protein
MMSTMLKGEQKETGKLRCQVDLTCQIVGE